MKRLPAAVASFVLACLGAPGPAAAGAAGLAADATAVVGEPAGPGAAREAGRAGPARTLQSGVSLDEAVDIVQRRYGGRVVRAETRQEDGETVHRIRLLSDDGRVITVSVNARTGRID